MSAPSLFDPIKLGAIEAPNRIVMAPLTRGRAGPGFVPGDLAREHYRQRASAGLIISEATGVSQEGLGWPSTPGIWTEAQVEGWKSVTGAVHEAGGRIIVQLWHMGRLVHPLFNDGKAPVSASRTQAEGRAYTPAGRQDYAESRPLRLDEIPRLIADYASAAENAKRAGFDGVQLHGANGYLIDQFLRGSTNLRDDDYGGPVENRIRLLREVTEALISVWGAGRVSVRLSPNGDSQGVDDSAPESLFPAAAAALDALGIAFLELREPGPDGTFGATEVPKQSPAIRRAFRGPLILNSDYDVPAAEADIARGVADAVSFGRPFIGNPDLVERIRSGAGWAPDNPKTWYSPGAEGYTDYPALAEA
ncbi:MULTISPECIES: alkene reductase [unclassified Sphingopyxis]|uniref:alkene reductase n=1 Tax=unclassified Sphingopyxis TaxID=2614943 RepID=UPI00285E54F0|nr:MULTISPECIES: alkene reductase [unclassified Sphingopyxis]MDR7060272.1 2,4-dienoyl-CoA reductase-like NADH-dependent reductase (Old Yellow Enzyme family) [Sphingopyxis sp. BE235]MDR7180215.1 2,4-dienoyl-CoA reductase-like NADH-dependent reductase (Old Yellow Enzyme family) [Sphingopyxis sp. BE249]